MNRLSPVELSYIAGLYDANGSSIHRRTSKGVLTIYIYIVHPEDQILEWVAGSLGIGRVSPRVRGSNFFRLERKEDLTDFIDDILPYIRSPKKEQRLSLIREFIGIKPEKGHRKLSREAKARREAIIEQIRDLGRDHEEGSDD